MNVSQLEIALATAAAFMGTALIHFALYVNRKRQAMVAKPQAKPQAKPKRIYKNEAFYLINLKTGKVAREAFPDEIELAEKQNPGFPIVDLGTRDDPQVFAITKGESLNDDGCLKPMP